jgi:hypothetical protein
MKRLFLTLLLGLLAAAAVLPASAQYYEGQIVRYNGQVWRRQNGIWMPLTAPTIYEPTHGYRWYPGHYGPTGVWYDGQWLAY